jgi:hypothetical protein
VDGPATFTVHGLFLRGKAGQVFVSQTATGPSSMSALFKKNLTDLVRGIRNNKNNEQQYISACIQEIKNELRGDNNRDKMVAIQKLTYVRTLLWLCIGAMLASSNIFIIFFSHRDLWPSRLFSDTPQRASLLSACSDHNFTDGNCSPCSFK